MDKVQERNESRRWHLAAWLIRDVRLGRAMVAGGALYGILSFTGILRYSCPWHALTGLPCPGCGMTRGALALLEGDWKSSLRHNSLTGVMLVFWVVVGIGVVLPGPARERFSEAVGRFERKSRWALWFGIALIIYTLTRWMRLL